jgi:hypothetical protein
MQGPKVPKGLTLSGLEPADPGSCQLGQGRSAFQEGARRLCLSKRRRVSMDQMPTNHTRVLLEDVHEVIREGVERTQAEPVVKGDRLAESVPLTMPGELEIGSPRRPYPTYEHRREPAATPARFGGAMLRWKARLGRSQGDQPAPGGPIHGVGPRQLSPMQCCRSGHPLTRYGLS